MRGGSKPGERRGGRKKGSLNKATLERAERQRLQGVKAQGLLRKLAKEELEEMVPTIKEAAAHFKPTLERDETGSIKIASGDFAEFKSWLKFQADVLGLLAQYQSPTFRAIAVANTDGPASRVTKFQLRIIDGRDNHSLLIDEDGNELLPAKVG